MTAATNRVTRREPVAGHPRPDDFRHRAACRSVDPEVFFPTAVQGREVERQVSVAKAVCTGCPVRLQCLDWALTRLPDGTAGGMTEHERRQERPLGVPADQHVPNVHAREAVRRGADPAL